MKFVILLSALIGSSAFASDCSKFAGSYFAMNCTVEHNGAISWDGLYSSFRFTTNGDQLKIERNWNSGNKFQPENYITTGEVLNGDAVNTGSEYRAVCRVSSLEIGRKFNSLIVPIYDHFEVRGAGINFEQYTDPTTTNFRRSCSLVRAH